MNFVKNMIWLTIITVLFSVFILPGIFALGIRYIPYDIQPPLERVKNIYGKYTIFQEFTSQDAQLTGIAMTIKNPNLKNKKDFFLDLYNDQGEMLREIKFNGANVEDGSYIKFLFDPIADSIGKKYNLVLSNPSGDEEEVLGIYYTLNKPAWIGKMTFNLEEQEGGISLVTFHKPQSKLGVIKTIYSNWLSRLL